MNRSGAKASSSFVTVNGVSLAYREWGSGHKAILCLPHLTGHKASFARLAAALVPSFRIIALDLRGRGDSAQPDDGYGFAYHGADVFGFAEALGLESFLLIGHSFGATTAAYIASIQPERVRALVLLDGGREPPERTLRAMAATIEKLQEPFPSLDAYVEAKRLDPAYQPWSAAFTEYFATGAVQTADGTVRAKGSARGIARDLDQHRFYRVRYNLAGITCPTLFLRPMLGLRGGRGHVYSHEDADALVASLRDARRVDVPEVNHYSMLIHDKPPVIEPIRDFFKEIGVG